MLLFGKTAVPEIGHFIPSRATFEQIIQTPTLLLVAPAGTLIVESLATVLIHSGRRVLWLRAGPEDRDPAQFLLGLIGAAQQVVPTAGSMTRELMRRQPGPIKGWAGLFAELAQELLAQLPPECTLVIEHAELLDDPAPTLQLLSSQILPVLSSSCACVLIADYDLPRSLLPERVLRCSAQALQLTLADLQGLADHGASGLSHATMQRALALLQGHADALFSFCRIASRLGPQTTSQLVLSARNAEQLLVSAARAGLRLEQPATRQSLDLSLRLPGLHPDLLAAIGQPALPDLAWLVPLQNQWVRLRSVWQALLPRSLRESEQAPEGMLLRLADCLVQQDALVLAVPLLLGLEQHEHAAALISDALEDLMGLGQWETLQGWLDQLPRATLHNWPWLVYAQGEMAAAQHDLDLARRSFAMASNLFTARRELEGLCQSLLAEGTLALWQGEPLLAQTRVLSAYGHAESAGMAWQHGWAAWQLFCLAMADGDSDSALIYLDRALGAALEVGEPVLTELLRMVEELLVQRRDLLHQRVLHEQAVRSYEQAERLVSERLRDLVVLQPAQSELLVANHPWSDIPLLLKLSAPQQRLSTAPPETLWQSFLRVLGLRRQLAGWAWAECAQVSAGTS